MVPVLLWVATGHMFVPALNTRMQLKHPEANVMGTLMMVSHTDGDLMP